MPGSVESVAVASTVAVPPALTVAESAAIRPLKPEGGITSTVVFALNPFTGTTRYVAATLLPGVTVSVLGPDRVKSAGGGFAGTGVVPAPRMMFQIAGSSTPALHAANPAIDPCRCFRRSTFFA